MVCHKSTHSFLLNFVSFVYGCVYMECLLKCVCKDSCPCCLPSSVAFHLTFWDRVTPELAVDRPPGHICLWLPTSSPTLRAGLQVSTSLPDLSICAGDPNSDPHVCGRHFTHWAIYLATSVSLLVSVPLPLPLWTAFIVPSQLPQGYLSYLLFFLNLGTILDHALHLVFLPPLIQDSFTLSSVTVMFFSVQDSSVATYYVPQLVLPDFSLWLDFTSALLAVILNNWWHACL